MKVTVLREFYDLLEGKMRCEGDTFECTEARAKEIDGKLPGYVEIHPKVEIKKELEPKESEKEQ